MDSFDHSDEDTNVNGKRDQDDDEEEEEEDEDEDDDDDCRLFVVYPTQQTLQRMQQHPLNL
jgi:hypothetical protein